MAKLIKVTDSVKEAILEDVMKRLDKTKMGANGFRYENAFVCDGKRSAQVIYTKQAWFKTMMLVDTEKDEVGWHGLCYRDENDPTVFKVTDIIVYPQKVTGTTINPDAIEYTKWLDDLSDDAFNHLRMHGHSHVNMEVFSSSTDEAFRNDRLSQLGDDDFYVFQVFNKRGDIHSAIYDCQNNILYENNEVKTLVECEDMAVWDSYVKVARVLNDVGTDVLSEALVLYSNSNMEKFLSDVRRKVEPDTTPKYQNIEIHPPTYKKKRGTIYPYSYWDEYYYDY